MHSNTAQMYMENDLILPLDDYIAADDAIDLDNYYDEADHYDIPAEAKEADFAE